MLLHSLSRLGKQINLSPPLAEQEKKRNQTRQQYNEKAQAHRVTVVRVQKVEPLDVQISIKSVIKPVVRNGIARTTTSYC